MSDIIDAKWVKEAIPKRERCTHKGNYGRLGIVAGSRKYRGAAALAVESAIRTGAGLTFLVSTEEVCAAVAQMQPCCIFSSQPGMGGELLAELEGNYNAVLAGNGLGATAEIAGLVQALLESRFCPMVLDADALNCLAGHLEGGPDEVLRKKMLKLLAATGKKRTAAGGQALVITPHIGEMARLCGKTTAEVCDTMEDTALAFAQEYGCVVVLKDWRTVVASPGGSVMVYDEGGNPGLAKGGSGDVLAGAIAALLAQGIAAEKAAGAGVWLHSEAGRRAAGLYGELGMTPCDLPLYMAETLRDLDR